MSKWLDVFDNIIKKLKEDGWDSLVSEILAEAAREFDSGRSLKSKNVAVVNFRATMAMDVTKQLEQGPTNEELGEYRKDLARRIAIAMRKPPEFRTAEAERDAVADVVRRGSSLRVTYCEGVYTAIAGDIAGEGLTWAEAVTNLAKKIENFSGASQAHR